MDPTDDPDSEDGNPAAAVDDLVPDSIQDAVDPVEDLELAAIGADARALDANRTVRERMRLSRSTVRRLGLLVAAYLAGVAVVTVAVDGAGRFEMALVPLVVVLAFLFELVDSAAGMGYGTALAPLLLVLGYSPLEVTPALLVSETVTGAVAGGVHDELDNVTFVFDPPNDETKLAVFIAVVGAGGAVASIVLAYFALTVSDAFIEAYVSLLVIAMGAVGLVHARFQATMVYRPRRLVAFALLAGINKGIGGGGFGPVITLGQILSGVYEKSATAIASLSEGAVSLIGVGTFFVLASRGVAVDLTLLPSVVTGGFLAAIGSPYLVRVVPNRVWRYLIPLYAFAIGLLGLGAGLGA